MGFLRSFVSWFSARFRRRTRAPRLEASLRADHNIQSIRADPNSNTLSRGRVHWSSTANSTNVEPYSSIPTKKDSPPSQPHLIILISLSYPNKRWSHGSTTSDGPKSDLRLLLNYLQYRHRSEPRRFMFLTDFDFEYTDSSGVVDIVPTILATKRNIQSVLQGAMEDLRMGDKCLIYYDGHVDLERPSEGTYQPPAYLVTTDEQRIHDRELRAWIRESRSPNSTIIAVFDAANSCNFLGLPYAYEKQKKREGEDATPSTERMTSKVIEISSARNEQPSLSGYFGKEKTLTWYLIQYLQANPQANLAGLASYLSAKCDPSDSGLQAREQEARHLPVLSCSRELDGRFSLF